MPVSNAHLGKIVQVWNGKSMSFMDKSEAKKAQKEGSVQITTNLQASQLKRPNEFEVVKEPKKKKKEYKTREMKAD